MNTSHAMSPRERVLTALNHERVDRCPLHASFTPEFASRLAVELGQPHALDDVRPWGATRFELERAIGEDMLLVGVGLLNSSTISDEPYMDEWGIGRKAYTYQTRFGTGRYEEMISHPLADERAISGYHPPDPDRPELYADAEQVIDHFGREYFIVGVTVVTIFETAWALRGLDRLLADLLIARDRAEAILDIAYRYHLAAARHLVRLGVDMIWTGDDVGGQTRMLMAPAMWRQVLKPRMATFIAELKAINPALKVAYHSDGFIDPIIGDLVEIGLDVLNPIQPPCVDFEKVAREFGDKLCFWGTIDIQRTLPFGTPGDVRCEVASRVGVMGNRGGLILGPTHHVQLDTPMENFLAMVSAIKADGRKARAGAETCRPT
jgi:uroporphyrinogen decarboxylase